MEMEQRKTPKANRVAKGRGSTRNVGNLHVINTKGLLPSGQNVPAPITNPPDYIRTVTMTPKRNVQTPEPLEAKNIVAHKTPIAARVFAVQKDAAMTYTKKKINAAKNFLQQHNKESPVKKPSNPKGNLTDGHLKPSLSSNDPPSNLINNNPLPSPSNNMTSNPSNGNLATNSSNNSSKPKKFKPVSISHQSHSCLALYEVDMTLKARKLNKAQTKAPPKEKKTVLAQEEESGSSWVPIDMKKVNVAKDSLICDKNKISATDKNTPPLRNIEENQSRPVFDKHIPKEKNNPMKEIPPKGFADSQGERSLIHGYSGSSRHFPVHEEEQYYENIYRLSRTKPKRSRDYERENKRYYKESYPYYFSKKTRRGRQRRRKSFHEEPEALEDVSDVPLDEDFEEVETASVEDPNKAAEIPVGFRKYKIRYLASKSIGFFKPKRYDICQDRTVVSCLNMEDESVDVVSEAEYETDHTAVEKNSENANGVEINSGDNKLKITSKDTPSDVLKTVNEPAKIEHPVQVSETADAKLPEKSEPNPSEEVLAATDLDDSAAMDTNVVDTRNSPPAIKEKQEVISSSKFYYTCLPESEFPDFYQGHSLFQKHLDDWESHLIGLEYIVELRNIDKTQANKYYCGLCMEQLTGVNTDGQIVTNHVSSFEHSSSYMAKHFPSCDYKFSKNESSSIVLQRCCKEINHKLSYNFLCVSTADYFQKHEKEVNELLHNLPHWSETDIDIDVNDYVDHTESDIDRDVSELMKDMIRKIAPGEEIATFITSRNGSPQESRRKKARNSILEKDSPLEDKTVESGRNLIVLTPQHSNIPSIPPVSRSIPKCSNDLRPNLLRVITCEETDSSVDNSVKVAGQAVDSSDQKAKEGSDKTVSSPVDSEAFNFKSINKKAVSYRKYRAKPTGNTGTKGTENDEPSGVRTVRKITKNSGEITVFLESKNIDKSADMDDYEEEELENSSVAEEITEELSNESGIQLIEDSTVDSNFSDSLGGSNVISVRDADSDTAEVSKNRGKTRHRSHQRATAHSKHCIKRILSRSSKSGKESGIKKEFSDLDLKLDTKSNDSSESELGRKFKDLSPTDSKGSVSSRKITSPLRTRYSPVFSSDVSRMSVRKRSRSPLRRRSRSPIRRRRSPFRRSSRSPPRRRSRSPRRHSRSPVRRRSRSPKRRSRSPVRRSSRSPIRRRSRSPVRRRSRSPVRRRSRSPIRRRSRSPGRKRSRSPIRRRSRSPIRKRSRSPVGHRSRSPRTSIRRKSRSPIRSRISQKVSTSPPRRAYASDLYSASSKHQDPLRRKYDSEEGSLRSESRSSLYGDFGSKSESQKEFATSSHSRYSQHLLHESERDLDPISDDEEPACYNSLEGPRHLEEIKKLPEPTRSMVMQLLQKFTASKVTAKDPSFSELMQFVSSHNSEMSKPVREEGVSNLPTSGLALQRFLLSNLAETSSHQNLPSHAVTHGLPAFHSPHSTGVPFAPSRPDLPQNSFSQPSYPPTNVPHHVPVPHSVPPPLPQVQPPTFDNQPAHSQFNPPQYDSFRSQNEPPSFQPKTRSDGMFKNLKDTVNKLFGANEGNSHEQAQHPLSHEFMPEQSQAQWGQDSRNAYQFDSLGPKNVISNERDDSDFRNHSRGGMEPPNHSIVYQNKPDPGPYYQEERNPHRLHAPPPDAKVAFCEPPHPPMQKNLFPVVSSPKAVNDVKVSLAQRLAAVLVKVGMLDVSGALLQEMLMKIGAFSSCPPQDISEDKIIDILRRLGYLNRY